MRISVLTIALVSFSPRVLQVLRHVYQNGIRCQNLCSVNPKISVENASRSLRKSIRKVHHKRFDGRYTNTSWPRRSVDHQSAHTRYSRADRMTKTTRSVAYFLQRERRSSFSVRLVVLNNSRCVHSGNSIIESCRNSASYSYIYVRTDGTLYNNYCFDKITIYITCISARRVIVCNVPPRYVTITILYIYIIISDTRHIHGGVRIKNTVF